MSKLHPSLRDDAVVGHSCPWLESHGYRHEVAQRLAQAAHWPVKVVDLAVGVVIGAVFG